MVSIKSKEFKTIIKKLKKDKQPVNSGLTIDSIAMFYKIFLTDSGFTTVHNIPGKTTRIKNCKLVTAFISNFYKLDNLIENDTSCLSVKDTKVKAMIEKFSQLSKEKKRTKILAVLEYLKDSGDIFETMYTLIKSTSTLSDSFYLTMYESIMKYGNDLEKNGNPKYYKSVKLYLSLVYYYYDKCI
jgi:hypothetical protein